MITARIRKNYNTLLYGIFYLFILQIIQCCIDGSVMAQETRKFDVIRNGESVGTLQASSTITASGQLFYIESRVKVTFVVNIKVDYDQSNLYKDGILKKASVIRTVNGNIKTNTNILWNASGYICMKKNKDTIMQKELIKYTTAKLYFAEPIGIDKVYSEVYFVFLKLHQTGSHTYELTLPDGVKNYYTYDKGICSKVQAKTDYGTIYFIAK